MRDEPLPNVIQDKGKRALEALSLTPSEAAEMVRKKDDVIKAMLFVLKGTAALVGGIDEYKQFEDAACAAGVEV